MKLNATQLRRRRPSPDELAAIRRKPIYFIVEDVLDTYNVGAIFRVADALAVERVFLCGSTSTGPEHKIHKSSVGTWQWVPWEYAPTALEAIARLKAYNAKLKTIAIEQDARSVTYDAFAYQFPLALVVGHETEGIKKETLDACDAVVEISLYGVNRSLNVMVALAIVGYAAVTRHG